MSGPRSVTIGLAVSAALFCTGLSDSPSSLPSASVKDAPKAESVRRQLPAPRTLPWVYERQEDDTPIARSCSSEADGAVCVAVACRRDQGLTFEYYGPGRPQPDHEARGSVLVSTLKGVKRVAISWSLLNRPFDRRAPLSPTLAVLLAEGGKGLYEDEERKLPFTLKGSAAAIEAVERRCR